MSRPRSSSFADIDEAQASGILEDILRENNVLLGGSSIGKGFKKAARAYLKQQAQQVQALVQEHPDLNPNLTTTTSTDQTTTTPLLEDAFYVVDLGVLVSQVYQWRKYFPRVEPFYAVKCNPDPVLVKTLALLGCNFDCASQQEIQIVKEAWSELGKGPRQPQIIYANPCKARKHLIYAVTQGVRMVTFDNVQEVHKCAAISSRIELVLRIVTDDRGSQCRLSSKYGAPKARWRNLLQAAKTCGLNVVGVSFHVGSGCRDASRYELALQDARELFDLAKQEFGFEMTLLDIGGGFPGETHSTWNPEELDKFDPDYEEVNHKEGLEQDSQHNDGNNDSAAGGGDDTPYMYFQEIAEQVAPMIDQLFPSKDIRVIGEPGRYFVAAAATLVTSVVGARSNEIDDKQFVPEPVKDKQTSREIFERSREDENAIIRQGHSRGKSGDVTDGDEEVWGTITEELNQYAQYFCKQNFVTQETDAYNDGLDLYQEDFDTAADLLGVPDERQMQSIVHSVEGMTKAIAKGENQDNIISLAAAGEAAVSGMVLQAVADSAPLQDDYSYYLNDGVYGAFNNLMFDHATVRPRVLRLSSNHTNNSQQQPDSNNSLDSSGRGSASGSGSDSEKEKDQNLYASTVFGPTCDSIDVIARSVLLPKLKIGDWLYFQNMGAYTMAAASSFNGFTPTEKMYVCSVQPEYFEGLIAGPESAESQQSAAEPTNNNNKTSTSTSSSTIPTTATVETATQLATNDEVVQAPVAVSEDTGTTEEKKEDELVC